ncbi:MAG: hypothetical protein PWP21_1544, partial [Thermosediminibacterales bacterium]|nr:hypothetical protein [Thermosediminibacterales bacterium]
MKELTKIKLINWHYFTNETIEIKGSTLFTGDNGSGKSTILDAIQYVLVADLRNIRFNVSAHDETKRDLLGYVRCKTGIDTTKEQKYLRQGDITSYVALEFLDRKTDKYFVLGAVIDSYSDNINWKSQFFKIEDCCINDDLFIIDNRPRNINEFKIHMKGYKAKVYPSVENYRSDLLNKLGSLNERFFNLFVKAISFKPITDIRQFVYSYVLDEKRINIDVMRENFLRYKEYSDLAKVTKEKINELKKIKELYAEICKEEHRALVQEYLIKRAVADNWGLKLQKKERENDIKKNQLEKVKIELASEKERGEFLEKSYQAYRDSLITNSTFRLIEKLEEEIKNLKSEADKLETEEKKLKVMAQREADSVKELIENSAAESFLKQEYREKLARLLEFLDDAASGKIKGDFQEIINEALEVFNEVNTALNQSLWEKKALLNNLEEEIKELKKDLESLRNKKRVYDPKVTALKELITEKLKEKTGRNIEPDILCELLEIPNEKWQDAVEG